MNSVEKGFFIMTTLVYSGHCSKIMSIEIGSFSSYFTLIKIKSNNPFNKVIDNENLHMTLFGELVALTGSYH